MSEEEALKQIDEYLKKHKFKLGYAIDFPIYKILPEEVQLALKVLTKHGMQVLITLKPIEETKK